MSEESYGHFIRLNFFNAFWSSSEQTRNKTEKFGHLWWQFLQFSKNSEYKIDHYSKKKSPKLKNHFFVGFNTFPSLILIRPLLRGWRSDIFRTINFLAILKLLGYGWEGGMHIVKWDGPNLFSYAILIMFRPLGKMKGRESSLHNTSLISGTEPERLIV